MKEKKWFSIAVALVLVVSLVISLIASACAPAAPTGEGDCSDVEADLAAEEKKTDALEDEVSDLEKEIAALKKPAEIIEIAYQSVTAGEDTCPKCAAYFAEAVEEASGGRITVEVIGGEALVPTEEMLGATRDGIVDMFTTYEIYFPEKVPALKATMLMESLIITDQDFFNVFYMLGVDKLMDEAYADFGVQRIYTYALIPTDGLTSKTPIPDVDSLNGMKIRCGSASMSKGLEAAGASVIFLPGAEVYTALASGLIDACTWGVPSEMVGMGLQEVAKYWIFPALGNVGTSAILGWPTFWNNLSKADQTLLRNIGEVSASRGVQGFRLYNNYLALAEIDEYGVTAIHWSDEDFKEWMGIYFEESPKPTDPLGLEILDIITDYSRSMKYID